VKIALVAGLALASIGLTAGEAHALVVNVGGQDYDVTTFKGTWTEYSSTYDVNVLPWWNNQSLAYTFTETVKTQLGEFPVENGAVGPYFSFETFNYPDGHPWAELPHYKLYLWDNRGCYTPDCGFPQFLTEDQSVGYQRVFAVAQPLGGTPVPGPLPIFGVAAAFGTSRQLRKRIKAGNGVGSTSTPG
jgi:hypothetical protein